MSIISDYITPYINTIKAGILVAILAYCTWYIWDLHHTINSQTLTITKLESTIALQNQAILDAGKARELLQLKMDEVAEKNKTLTAKNKRLQGEIDNRPDSKTCEEAMDYIASTSKKVAEEFNLK